MLAGLLALEFPMTTTTITPRVIQRSEVGPQCPVCGTDDLGHVAGYAFASVPDPNPTWEELIYCRNDTCGWSEDWADGQRVAFTPVVTAPVEPIASDFDDDIPPF
jgi:hypothetical protein